jgi:hypothetical protein
MVCTGIALPFKTRTIVAGKRLSPIFLFSIVLAHARSQVTDREMIEDVKTLPGFFYNLVLSVLTLSGDNSNCSLSHQDFVNRQ